MAVSNGWQYVGTCFSLCSNGNHELLCFFLQGCNTELGGGTYTQKLISLLYLPKSSLGLPPFTSCFLFIRLPLLEYNIHTVKYCRYETSCVYHVRDCICLTHLCFFINFILIAPQESWRFLKKALFNPQLSC